MERYNYNYNLEKCIKKLEEENFSYYLNSLAFALYEGKIVDQSGKNEKNIEKDWDGALKIFKFLHEKKGECYTIIAEIYYIGGNGVERDLEKSAEWAKANTSKISLMMTYRSGKYGVEVNEEMAMKIQKEIEQEQRKEAELEEQKEKEKEAKKGLNCSLCKCFTPLKTMSCKKCGGDISYVTYVPGTVPTHVDVYTGTIQYSKVGQTEYYFSCNKCGVRYDKWRCPQCSRELTVSNYTD